jgi:hypothetical protein
MAQLAWLVWLLGLADAGAAGDAAVCRKTAAGVDAWIKAVVAAGALPDPVPLTLAPRLVSFRGAAVEAAPLVEITAQRISLDGRVVDGAGKQRLAELRTGIAQLYRMYGLLHPNEPVPDRVLLAVDRDVTWSQLVDVTGALAAEGVRNVDWMFASKRTQGAVARPPAPSPVDGELAAIRALTDPADKAAKLAALVARVVAPCPTVRKLIGDLADMNPASRPALLAEGVGPAVADCGCALDVTALEAVLFVTLGPGGYETQSVVRFRMAGAGGRPLKAAAATPWATGFRQVVDAARGPGATTTYRLTVR